MNTTTTPFSVVDEIMGFADSPQYPVSVHIEVKAPGQLNAEKMQAAVHAALDMHPLARARKLPPKPRDKQLFWEITPTPGSDPFLVIEGGSEAGVSRARNQLLSLQVPLHDSPPLRVWLVRCDSGDHLILNVHHAAADGIGTLRFLRSILHAYNDQPDETADVDALEVRDLHQLYSASNLVAQTRRLKSFASSMQAQMKENTPISANDGLDSTGYGCFHLTLEAEDVATLNPKKHTAGTFNDLLVAAMHAAVEIWNERQGDDSDILKVTSPVNLRPKEWWFEVFGNFAMAFATHTTPVDRESPAQLMTTITDQSRVAKEKGFAEAMLVGLGMNTKLPVWVKNLMFSNPGEKAPVGITLTNAGRIGEELSFGDDGEAVEVWMSPPAAMPDGLGLGITNYNGKIHLAFRHCYELLSDDSVADFAELYRETLDWLS
jgi:NRPS condensation-like uncharacterized protein